MFYSLHILLPTAWMGIPKENVLVSMYDTTCLCLQDDQQLEPNGLSSTRHTMCQRSCTQSLQFLLGTTLSGSSKWVHTHLLSLHLLQQCCGLCYALSAYAQMHKVVGSSITAVICRFGLQAASNMLLQCHISLLLLCADYLGLSEA